MRRLLLLLLPSVLCVGACRSATGPDDAIARAVRATEGAGTAAVIMQLTSTGLPGGTLEVTARGSIDFAGERSTMTVVYSDDRQVEQRIIGSAAYVRSTSTGDDWVAVSPPQLGNGDPGQALAFLASATKGTARRVGSATVAGVRTTHYRVQADTGETTATVDVWIDGHDLVRRAVVPLPTSSTTSAVATTATTSYERFGQTVAIEAPRLASQRTGNS